MAIITAGVVVSSISGNLGSENFVLGKQGPYIRRAPTKGPQKSTLQIEHQLLMAQITKAS